jgi:hypothetical protein
MFAKSLIVAATLASATMLVPATEAQAKVKLDIDVYVGGGGLPYYPVVDDFGKSCHQVRKELKWHGYKMINAFDCSAPKYGYTAWRNGNHWKLKVNMFGNILSKQLIP